MLCHSFWWCRQCRQMWTMTHKHNKNMVHFLHEWCNFSLLHERYHFLFSISSSSCTEQKQYRDKKYPWLPGIRHHTHYHNIPGLLGGLKYVISGTKRSYILFLSCDRCSILHNQSHTAFTVGTSDPYIHLLTNLKEISCLFYRPIFLSGELSQVRQPNKLKH